MTATREQIEMVKAVVAKRRCMQPWHADYVAMLAALDALLREREELRWQVENLTAENANGARAMRASYDSVVEIKNRVEDQISDLREEAGQCEVWRNRFVAVSIAMGDREPAEGWRSTHDLAERVGAVRQQLAEAQREIETGLVVATKLARCENRVSELEAQLQAERELVAAMDKQRIEMGDSHTQSIEAAAVVLQQLAASEEARKRAEEKLAVAETEGDSHWERARLLARDVCTTKKRAEAAEAQLTRLREGMQRICVEHAPDSPLENIPSVMLVPHYRMKQALLALLAEADKGGSDGR